MARNRIVSSSFQVDLVSYSDLWLEFLADLIVINDSGFDGALGMDWLGTFYALIDCRKKKVTFRVLSHPKF